jgi:hypothetical protein
MSMRNYLDELCGQNPDGIMIAVQFKAGAVVQGALRRAKGSDDVVSDLFELLGPGQVSDPQNPKIPKNVLVSNIFEAEAVERAIVFHDIPQPSIITPNQSGIIVSS